MDASVADLLVQVRDFSVVYQPASGPPIHAVNHAYLDIRPSEILGVMGESGSGKSTLGAALLRLLPSHAQYEGTVQFRGFDVMTLPEYDLQRIRGAEISLISQEPALALNPVISVGDQIAEVIRAHSSPSRAERRTRTMELLVEVGFDQPSQVYGAYPHQLSGGQRQRVVLAQAIACRPALVVADEPTSKLDASLRGEILVLLRTLAQRHRMAFLVITHDPVVLAGLVDRVAVMYAGRIVEQGPVDDIFRQPLHPYTQALIRLSVRYLASSQTRTRLPTIGGEPPVPDHRVAGCPFAARCPDRMDVCEERFPQESRPDPSRCVRCFKYES
jgi:oligopeptide/dipeptide ABC transporter ATP-binding protein